MAKRKDPKFFDKGVVATVEMSETGAMLAMRALAWGTLYAFLGTGAVCYGIWKLSGAKNVSFCGSFLEFHPKNILFNNFTVRGVSRDNGQNTAAHQTE